MSPSPSSTNYAVRRGSPDPAGVPDRRSPAPIVGPGVKGIRAREHTPKEGDLRSGSSGGVGRPAPDEPASPPTHHASERVQWDDLPAPAACRTMEDRTLLSTFLVTDAADSGPGSLRQAILDSNAATGTTNTIDFDIPGPGVQTIMPLSACRDHHPVLIDGESQPELCGLTPDRDQRQPGRRGRRADDHRAECHRPRPGYRQL